MSLAAVLAQLDAVEMEASRLATLREQARVLSQLWSCRRVHASAHEKHSDQENLQRLR